ncbi:fatty acid synthase [Drosophila sulfurigaster albostrigata]|uniref:fatty acid synthase n=1 Tax=Drosophila sulfurigaster albostrigata TaxID=89887 RepID=UPI002D218C0F|nr:fatty acid synthase [Drosophila sulfurigaster albostrigata]
MANNMVLKKDKKYSRSRPDTDGDDIVISGMAGKFPNSKNISEYEYNLYNKVDMVDDDERRWRHFNPEIPKRSGKINGLEKFDATFFGVHFKQAHTMDPQTRILIETAYEAVIDAGINPKSLRGTKTGVYIGSCISESEKTWFYEKVSSGGFGITGCSRAMMANRISYCLGLEGPSFLLDTACSSSMYALDNAFSAIRNGEIDAAIIGGSNLLLHPFVTLQFARLGVLAPDGFCRPFDKDASGYTRSETINCLFLQRKRDAKRVYASVIYSKTNCDGYKPEGITYPSGKVQEKLLEEFYKEIDLTPNDLGYLEAHSTGTVVGDPEECKAIDSVLCSQRAEPLLVGSVKSNVGHSEAASGICSLVKACFAFETGLIAPNINFTEVKPSITALAEGRLIVVKDSTPLPKPYIGINSFGFGGANAHAILKAFPKSKTNFGLPEDDLPRILTWAGRTEDAINEIFNAIETKPLDAEFIGLLQNIQEEDVSGLVFRGYGVFTKNGVEPTKAVARDVQHYTGLKRPIVWVYSGMGSQWNEMGLSLMTIPRFRESVEVCHKTLLPMGLDLINIITSDDPAIYKNILNSFVGIAACQIGLTDVLRSLDLEPEYIIGHSVGELGCAYADGGLTAEQMILAAYYRGKVSVDAEKIKGSMAAVGIGYKTIKQMLPPTIAVACHNGADSCTISGPIEDVAQFVAELKAKDIFAKEVPCSNIAYHSHYIAQMGPPLLAYMKETIPNPKPRTSRWLSTSVPKSEWEQPERKICSAEYHTNNLLNSVLFEETFALLPKNALTIEIAPHGLLGAILKRSMPGGVHIPLTHRGNKNNALFFMTALGKLYQNGVMVPVSKLYPKVDFPVSRSTPSISSLIRWDHSEDWFVTKYENMKTKSSGERVFPINLASDNEEFMSGHVIDGKILVPATCYLQYVWETFSLMYHGPSYMDVPVEFEEVQFLRATNMSVNGEVELNVMIHYGTGHFEITEGGSLVVTGKIREIESPTIPEVYHFKQESDFPMVSKKDFYKELKLRGYHYNGAFRAVKSARSDGLYGQVEWNYNWVTFMDAMLQIQILGTDSRSLLLPTKIRKLRINGVHHFDLMTKMDPENRVFDVYVDHKYDRIVAGGIELTGLHASPVQRRRPPGIPVLEKYEFIPYLPAPELSLSNAARLCVQLALENIAVMKVKLVEVDTDGRDTVLGKFTEAIEDLPVITGEYMYLTDRKIEEIPAIHVENGKLSALSNYHFVVAGGICGELNEDVIQNAQKVLVDNGYLLIRERPTTNLANLKLPEQFRLITVIPLDNNEEVYLLLQKISKKLQIQPTVVKVSDNDSSFEWLNQVQSAISIKSHVVAYAFKEKLNGLVGLVNCLRKEPDGNLVTCFYIDDPRAPEFDLADPFYASQYSLGLAFNIYRNGTWGSLRHLQLPAVDELKPRVDHIYGNVMQRGDLSSLRWFEGPLAPEDCMIKIAYSSLNFRDVMLATGRLAVELYGSNRIDQSCVLGFEYSGINTRTGRRIMSMVVKGGVASYVEKPSKLIWDIPDHWSLQEAATVPVVYITVYYAFFMATDIRKGKSILIHAGTGGIGLAAIRVALAYNLEVFTTCSTPQKKQFLLDTFPQLKESNIGNSRDTSFERMIQRETDGKGVDFVLNSLSEDKLLASVRCLGQSGHFLEIGKFDMANDSKLGLGAFLKELTFHAVLADSLLVASDEDIWHLKNLIDLDIASGIIQPLPVTVFPAHEIEQAFRHLIGGKHIGKVIIKVRETPEAPETLPVRVLSQVYFKPHMSYVIPGGLGGFGMELADWMALRGARKLVLSSSRGISKDYQSYRIALWKTYGCDVVVNTADISTLEGCRHLLQDAAKLGPVGGIFNLAVALRDGIFANQTAEQFVESFSPKAVATNHLDVLSRQLCPHLEHFVVFSSVSCGRGNAGQTNYGMANSVMERIIEGRYRDGLPAKAIQWGAVGEVGLVADMAEDKIDMEIGGTLQQRISSCLQELDTLLTAKAAIVASMVVAEKRSGRSGNESIIDTVMNIMGIRDLKSVSLGTTLSEMGMDSLMAVEIKQTLERDFELVLTPQDLRALTFQKLQEYVEAREKDNTDAVKMIFASEGKLLGMDLLLRNLGDESHCDQIMFALKTNAAPSKQSVPPNIIIPGMEGTAGQAWYNIGSSLQSRANVLQLHQFAGLETVSEIGQQALEHVKAQLKPSDPFYLIGYSYGSFVALQLAALLENSGFRGHVMLIDGAPHFLKRLTNLHLGENFSDNDLYDLLFSSIVNQIFPEETKESAAVIFHKLDTPQEKMDLFMEYVDKQSAYSKDYSRTMVEAMFRRVKMAANFDLDSVKDLKSPITLVRPAEVSLQDIEEDYCVSQLTSGKVTLKVIEGNHTTMLDNPVLPQLINDFDPGLLDDKNFEEYIRDSKAVAVV